MSEPCKHVIEIHDTFDVCIKCGERVDRPERFPPTEQPEQSRIALIRRIWHRSGHRIWHARHEGIRAVFVAVEPTLPDPMLDRGAVDRTEVIEKLEFKLQYGYIAHGIDGRDYVPWRVICDGVEVLRGFELI